MKSAPAPQRFVLSPVWFTRSVRTPVVPLRFDGGDFQLIGFMKLQIRVVVD